MLSAWHMTPETAADGEEALAKLATFPADVILTDLNMPGVDGFGLLQQLRDAGDTTPTIVITAFGNIEKAVQTVHELGAYWFLDKPIQPSVLEVLIRRAGSHAGLLADKRNLERQLSYKGSLGQLVGTSPKMQEIFSLLQQAAPSKACVLITGESGTGKEVVARAIHANSPRRNMPMVVIHCGALTETLLESELFGHERGAFTGAQFRRKGKFEVADGGTVFLDEISDISLRTQSDLLRVLQEKEIVRVGGAQPVKVDFRCVAATNRSIDELVKAGTFRPDLYYRLNVFAINIPPLRERREDIPLLADYFLRRFCASTNREPPHLSPAAIDALMAHDWPGNVRELENAVERALVVGRNGEIGPAHFALGVRAESLASGGRTLEEVERTHIEKVVAECDGNLSRAARVLEIDRTTLYHKLKRYRAAVEPDSA